MTLQHAARSHPADERELLVHALLTLTRLQLVQGNPTEARTTVAHAMNVARTLTDDTLLRVVLRLRDEVREEFAAASRRVPVI